MGMQGIVYSLEDKRRVLKALENSFGNITKAARVARVPSPTVRKWLNDKTEIWFNEKYEEIMLKSLDEAEALVRKKSKNTLKAAFWLLKSDPLSRNKWNVPKIIESGNMLPNNIDPAALKLATDLMALSPEEIAKLRQSMIRLVDKKPLERVQKVNGSNLKLLSESNSEKE